MDIKQLRYFISVAKHLNFTKAAQEHFMTQPALSQQIADLERHLGVKLFIRNRHSVFLTPAADELLPEAKYLVSKSDEFMQLANQVQSGMAGCLTIGVLGLSERSFLPSLILSYRSKYPHIKISLKLLSMGALDKALEAQNVDVGFTLIEKPAPSFLNWKTLKRDTLCVVSRNDNPLTESNDISFSDLIKETVFFQDRLTSPRGFNNLTRVCSNRGFTPNVNLAPNWGTVLMSVESGMGISILPRLIPDTYGSPNLQLSGLEGNDTQVEFVIAWNSANSNPAISFFLNELEKSEFLEK